MTGNDIRVRLNAMLTSSAFLVSDVYCTACKGTGIVARRGTKAISTVKVGKRIGVSRAQVSNFSIGKSGLSMEATLKLLEMLDEYEATPKEALRERETQEEA